MTTATLSPSVAQKVFRSAFQLLVRRVLVTLVSAGTTAVVARELGVARFGAYSAGLATFYLLTAATDFGFSYVLARELGAVSATSGRVARSMIHLQTIWSLILALVAIAIAIAAGLGTYRGDVILVTVPAIAFQGLAGIRQVYYANYRTGVLGWTDIAVNLVAAFIICGLALAGQTLVLIAAAVSVSAVLNTCIVYLAGTRLLDTAGAERRTSLAFLKASLPLGMASFLASAYFTLDLTIIGFIVGTAQLGYYSAAVKVLSILVTVPGMVTTVALPGLAAESATSDGLAHMCSRLWHWLAVIGLPLCLEVCVFAPAVVAVLFGPRFAPTVFLLRILCAAAAIALLSNVLGMAMVALRRTRWIVLQNAFALIFNCVGNIALVPRYGVAASAWLTLGTEAIVCGGSLIALGARLDVRPVVAITMRPLAAATLMVGVSVPLIRHPWLGMPAGVVVFLVVMTSLGGWPEEFAGILVRPTERPASA